MLYPQVNTNEDMLRQAVKEYNLWHGAACIRYDVRTGEVWTDIYITALCDNPYKSKNIVPIYDKDKYLDRNCTISVERMREYVRRCHEYDWDALDERGTAVAIFRIDMAVCNGH